jgi:hypothetical protein
MNQAIVLLILSFTLPAGAQNLLKNAGFESEDASRPGQAYDWWTFTPSGMSGPSAIQKGPAAKEGVNTFKLAFEDENDPYVGVSQNLPIEGGQNVKLVCFVQDAGLAVKSYAQLALEWKDSSGEEISRDLGEGINNANTTIDGWTQFEIVTTSPPKTKSVTVTATIHTAGEPSGAILLDALVLQVVQEP